MSKEYGYIGKEITQAFGSNKGIFTPQDISELKELGDWSSAGQLELIKTENYGSAVADITFTNLNDKFGKSYDVHFMTINNMSPSGNNVRPRIRFLVGGVEQTSNYNWAYQQLTASGSSLEIQSGSSTVGFMEANFEIENAGYSAGHYHFYNLSDSTRYSFMNAIAGRSSSSSIIKEVGGGVHQSASAVDGIKLFWSDGGNFTSFNVSIYGYRYF